MANKYCMFLKKFIWPIESVKFNVAFKNDLSDDGEKILKMPLNLLKCTIKHKSLPNDLTL